MKNVFFSFEFPWQLNLESNREQRKKSEFRDKQNNLWRGQIEMRITNLLFLKKGNFSFEFFKSPIVNEICVIKKIIPRVSFISTSLDIFSLIFWIERMNKMEEYLSCSCCVSIYSLTTHNTDNYIFLRFFSHIFLEVKKNRENARDILF